MTGTRLEIEITKATVLLDYYGMDTVILTTTLPASVASHPDTPLYVEFKATNGEGVEYVRRNFGIEPEVTVVQAKVEHKFSRRAAAGGKEEGP